MAVMSAIHPTTYAPLCVEVGEFLPLYVKTYNSFDGEGVKIIEMKNIEVV